MLDNNSWKIYLYNSFVANERTQLRRQEDNSFPYTQRKISHIYIYTYSVILTLYQYYNISIMYICSYICIYKIHLYPCCVFDYSVIKHKLLRMLYPRRYILSSTSQLLRSVFWKYFMNICTEKSFRGLIKSNRNYIVYSIFRNGMYNPKMVYTI